MDPKEQAAADAAAATAKAAADADAAAKVAAAKGAKGAEEKDDDEPEAKTYTADAYKKLQAEAKSRRESEKKALEENARFKKALGIRDGKPDDEVDPVKKVTDAANAKLKRLGMKAAIAAEAKDAHDPAALMDAYPSAFKDIDVDLETGDADAEQVKEAIEVLRKAKPFLFAGAKSNDTVVPKKGGAIPLDGAGKPKGGSNHYAVWQELTKSGPGRAHEAAAYYKEHRADIMAQMKLAG